MSQSYQEKLGCRDWISDKPWKIGRIWTFGHHLQDWPRPTEEHTQQHGRKELRALRKEFTWTWAERVRNNKKKKVEEMESGVRMIKFQLMEYLRKQAKKAMRFHISVLYILLKELNI